MLESLCFWSNDEDQQQKWQIPYWCTILFTEVKSVFLWQAWKGLEMPWLLTTSGAVGQWWSEPCAVCLENYTDFCMVATGTLTGIQVQGWNPQIHSKTLCWFSGTWVSLGVEKYPTSCEQSVWQFLHDKIWDLCDMYWCILHQLWSLLILDWSLGGNPTGHHTLSPQDHSQWLSAVHTG